MNYLLDTHTFLWYFWDSKDLSVASLWEFSIKYSMGKLTFDGGLAHLWDMLTQNGFVILPITQPQLGTLISELPFHHRDPFDRLIVATAKAEELIIVTADENIKKYDISCIW